MLSANGANYLGSSRSNSIIGVERARREFRGESEAAFLERKAANAKEGGFRKIRVSTPSFSLE
jgi:hypothetical protein